MDSTENTTKKKKSEIFVEKDVLGQEKLPTASTGSKARPNRIFIVLAIIIAVAIIYRICAR